VPSINPAEPAEPSASHVAEPSGSPATEPGAVLDPVDVDIVAEQLGRAPRAIRAVAHRCGCGLPDVVETSPRLADGTPFPTLYYLTCPRAVKEVSRLEAGGVMRSMTERLTADADLGARYRAAHEDYLRRRDALDPLPGGISAGGMPGRVKCLHVLVAHSLAVGPGVNPFGDEALAMLPDWAERGPCVTVPHAPDEPGHATSTRPGQRPS
jgi:hypothetical protein